MGNRAAAIRAKFPDAQVIERTASSIVLRLGTHPLTGQEVRHVVATPDLHYHDGDWQEANTDLTASTDPAWDDECVTLPYRVRVKDGVRRLYPRRSVTTEYIELGRPEFQRNNGTWANIPFNSRTREGNTVSFHRADGRIDVVVGPGRLKINLILDSAPARNVWRFPISLVGLTRVGRQIVSQADATVVSVLAPFIVTDAAGISREVEGQLTGHPTFDGAYQVSPDLAGLTYPVVIDPTIDVNISASLDDGHKGAFSSWNVTTTDVAFGNLFGDSVNAFLRFAISGPTAGSTVTAAYVDLVWRDTLATTGCNVLITADDRNDPAAPTSVATLAALTSTTASVAWNNIASATAGAAVSTPSIVSVIQELWDSGFGLNGEHIQILITNNASTSGALRQAASWDHATYEAPALVITYTPPSQNVVPSLFTNTQTFYPPTVTTGGVNVAPSLFTNTQTFYPPTLTVGAVTISPSLFTNTQVFYDHTVESEADDSQQVTPALFTNTQVFYIPVITTGGVEVAPALFTNEQVFYAPTITTGGIEITPDLFTNEQVFYAPVVTPGGIEIAPALFINEQVFYVHSVGLAEQLAAGPNIVVLTSDGENRLVLASSLNRLVLASSLNRLYLSASDVRLALERSENRIAMRQERLQ